MANSTIISDIKNKVIKEIINDELIVLAIDSDNYDPEDITSLINNNIFRFNQNPNTIDSVNTFITVQVHTRNIPNSIYVKSRLEFWIYSNNEHMMIKNIPNIVDNRNDYISMLFDKKFNGRSDIGGYGELELAVNDEGAFSEKFLYRHMIFQTKDINNSICDNYN